MSDTCSSIVTSTICISRFQVGTNARCVWDSVSGMCGAPGTMFPRARPDDDDVSTAPIALIVVGCVLVCALNCCIVFYCYCTNPVMKHGRVRQEIQVPSRGIVPAGAAAGPSHAAATAFVSFKEPQVVDDVPCSFSSPKAMVDSPKSSGYRQFDNQ